MVDSYLLLGLEIYHSLITEERSIIIPIFLFLCTLTFFTYTFSYCHFCFVNFDNLTVILHGEIIFCSYLFEVPYASFIWISISFSKVGQFFAAISLKLFVPLVNALAPSLSLRKLYSILLKHIPERLEVVVSLINFLHITIFLCHLVIHHEILFSDFVFSSHSVFIFILLINI